MTEHHLPRAAELISEGIWVEWITFHVSLISFYCTAWLDSEKKKSWDIYFIVFFRDILNAYVYIIIFLNIKLPNLWKHWKIQWKMCFMLMTIISQWKIIKFSTKYTTCKIRAYITVTSNRIHLKLKPQLPFLILISSQNLS